MKITRKQLRKLVTETMYSQELTGYLDSGRLGERGNTLHLEMERVDKEDGGFYIINTYVDRLTGKEWDHNDIEGDAARLGHVDSEGFTNPFVILYNMGYDWLIEDEVEKHSIARLARGSL